MSKGLLIVGAGGHGKVVADAAIRVGNWQHLAFIDDNPALPGELLGLPVLRDTARIAELKSNFPDAVVAVGDATRRLALIDQLLQLSFNLIPVCHPDASISPFCEIGAGTVVFAQSAINAGSRLGIGCIINTGATVDHDCTLSDGVHVSPGAHLAGGVSVGRGTWIGVGSCVRELIVIGDHVTVGAGAAVVTDVPTDQTVVGVPALPQKS